MVNENETTIEVELEDKHIAILKELSESGKPLNLGTDADPLWVKVEWLEDDSVKMSRADVDK